MPLVLILTKADYSIDTASCFSFPMAENYSASFKCVLRFPQRRLGRQSFFQSVRSDETIKWMLHEAVH